MMKSGIGDVKREWGGGAAEGVPTILVIADAGAGTAPEDAVVAAGARLLGRVGWGEAQDRLARQGAMTVVLAEAHGASEVALGPVYAILDTLGRSGDARIVVSLDFDQIDVASASLSAPGIELLCAPTGAERVAALCVAGMRAGDRVHDVGREAEAVRLRRLNEEVARIAETLARLTRSDGEARTADFRNGTVGEPSITYRGPPASAHVPDVTARDIREAIRARRLRDHYFGSGLFEDPAWDMLLDLFAAELERAQVSVSSLCIAAAVAPTTALRWITRMTEAGLFERQPDPFDRRRAFMGLSDRASLGMRNYVAAVRRAGGSIA